MAKIINLHQLDIDGRKAAEKALGEAEEIFKLLVSAVEDYAIFALDPKGYILTWNTGAEKLKGYTPDEIIGSHFSRFYTSEDVARHHPEEELEIAARVGKYQEDGWRVRKDGSRFWANIVITALRDSDGTVRGFAKVTRDLTDKKFAEEKLRESEERMRLMVQSVKDYAIFLLDPKGMVASWNEGARQFKGYEADEIIGQHFSRFYSEEERHSKPKKLLEDAVRLGRVEDEGWRIRKDGSRFWADVVITAIKDHAGRLIGFTKVTRDLTERKAAEEKLKQGEEQLRRANESLEAKVEERTKQLTALNKLFAENELRYRTLVETVPQLVWTDLPSGECDYLSRQWIEYTGIPFEEQKGFQWVDRVLHPDDKTRVLDHWMGAVKGLHPYDIEYRIRRHDGIYRWFKTRGTPIHNDEGEITYWMGTCTDVEDQKQTEHSLREAIDKLKIVQIMREQFVATLTHDLRIPLTSAQMSAQMLVRNLSAPPDKLASLSGRIIDSIGRSNQMIENLLDANRIEAGESLRLEMKEVGLVSLVTETLNELTSVLGDRFVLEAKNAVINGFWSYDGIRRIVENLCTNAVKYGSERSPVKVTLERRADEVSISVHNMGNPIPPGELKNLFEPFRRATTASDKGKGWGLGLTLVKGFAEAHHGKLEVESSLENGTRFTVLLPRDPRSVK
jgi:PAS domain S-box-containing protein